MVKIIKLWTLDKIRDEIQSNTLFLFLKKYDLLFLVLSSNNLRWSIKIDQIKNWDCFWETEPSTIRPQPKHNQCHI